VGVRRERPPGQAVGSGSAGLRLGDGTTVSVSLGREPEAADEVCCFCGEQLDEADPDRVTVTVSRADELGEPRSRTAHAACLPEPLRES